MEGTVTTVPNQRADLAKSLSVPKRLTTQNRSGFVSLDVGSVGRKQAAKRRLRGALKMGNGWDVPVLPPCCCFMLDKRFDELDDFFLLAAGE